MSGVPAEPIKVGCRTRRGRSVFVVNVEVFLHRDGRWLLIRRSAQEDHAPNLLSGIGGKVELAVPRDDVLEETARREVAEEVGVSLAGVELRYIESRAFMTDDGDPVVNVVFSAPLPAAVDPVVTSPEEVARLVRVTLGEAEVDASCPPWIRGSLRRAAR